MLRKFLALALAGAAATAAAQLVPDIHIDWKEAEAPPPPALRTSGLIPVEVVGTTLKFGVDPASITVGSDGVVRYVVVATSNTGAVNGIYEGLRCNTGEAKVYARHNPDTGWVPAKGEWRNVWKYAAIAINRGYYTVPVTTSWSMRMMSNPLPGGFPQTCPP